MPRYRVRGARVAEARQQQLRAGLLCALNSHNDADFACGAGGDGAR